MQMHVCAFRNGARMGAFRMVTCSFRTGCKPHESGLVQFTTASPPPRLVFCFSHVSCHFQQLCHCCRKRLVWTHSAHSARSEHRRRRLTSAWLHHNAFNGVGRALRRWAENGKEFLQGWKCSQKKPQQVGRHVQSPKKRAPADSVATQKNAQMCLFGIDTQAAGWENVQLLIQFSWPNAPHCLRALPAMM